MAKKINFLDLYINKDNYLAYWNNIKPNNKFHHNINNYASVLGYSQNGEDGVLKYIFDKIGVINKYYVEFGAWDGIEYSNTYYFREQLNWTGLLLEGDDEKIKTLSNDYINRINLHNEFVTKDNINELFLKYNVPKQFDLLSIDIDSYDYEVWKGLTEFSPNVVIVEINPGIPNELPLVIDKTVRDTLKYEDTGYFGANLLAFYRLALIKGYEFITVLNWNAIFVKKNEFSKLNINHITEEECIKHYNKPEMFWANLVANSLDKHIWINVS